MSLIVEALKKSEAQRRVGETPTFNTPALWPESPAYKSTSRRRAAIWLSVLAILILAGLAWQFSRAPADADMKTSSQTKPELVSANQAATPTDQTTPASSSNDASETLAKLQRGEVFNQPNTTPMAQTKAANSTPQPRENDGNERPTETLEISNSKTASQDVMPSKTLEMAPIKQTVPPLPALREDQAVVVAALPDNTESRNTPNSAAAPLPLEFELPASVREKLPPVKISMHVFASNATNRFVLLNGVRYNEGATIAPKFFLREIRAEGIVLEFDGRAFFKPIPRP